MNEDMRDCKDECREERRRFIHKIARLETILLQHGVKEPFRTDAERALHAAMEKVDAVWLQDMEALR